MKLKHKDIRAVRERLWHEQQGLCPLCQTHIELESAVLDHCHKTGAVRGTIHRNCNMYIGKMENNLARNRITPEMLDNILNNFVEYIGRDQGFLHPTYKTKEERIMAMKKKRKGRGKGR